MTIITDKEIHALYAMGGLITGGAGQRVLVYVSKAAPPLPPSAGWWQTFAYNLLKGASGHDPSTNQPKINVHP
jgi:hypothetical protein